MNFKFLGVITFLLLITFLACATVQATDNTTDILINNISEDVNLTQSEPNEYINDSISEICEGTIYDYLKNSTIIKNKKFYQWGNSSNIDGENGSCKKAININNLSIKNRIIDNTTFTWDDAIISFKNCTFQNINDYICSFGLVDTWRVIISFDNCTFKNSNIYNLFFNNCLKDYIIKYKYCNISIFIKNCNFFNISSREAFPLFELFYCEIVNLTKGNNFNVNFVFDNCYFENIYCKDNCFITAEDFTSITNCVFKNCSFNKNYTTDLASHRCSVFFLNDLIRYNHLIQDDGEVNRTDYQTLFNIKNCTVLNADGSLNCTDKVFTHLRGKVINLDGEPVPDVMIFMVQGEKIYVVGRTNTTGEFCSEFREYSDEVFTYRIQQLNKHAVYYEPSNYQGAKKCEEIIYRNKTYYSPSNEYDNYEVFIYPY